MFNIGDVVKLKSADYRMTVVMIQDNRVRVAYDRYIEVMGAVVHTLEMEWLYKDCLVAPQGKK